MDYQKLYNTLISFRKCNSLKKSKKLYTELHHVVPRCLGGTDDIDNLVRLTAREHFVAHRLLAKIYPDSKELTLALVLMIRGRGRDNKIVSSREFYRLKEISSKTLSSYMTSSLLHLWKTESYRSRMQGVLTKSNSERWKDENFKIKMSEKLSRAAIKRCEGSQNKKRMSDAMNGFYERNPMPWMRPQAQASRHMWTLAATFWELSKYNINNERPPLGYCAFCSFFLKGEHKGLFENMEKLFKSGWKPLECELYLKEFGYRM